MHSILIKLRYGEYERAWAVGNKNVHELFYLIGVILMFSFLT